MKINHLIKMKVVLSKLIQRELNKIEDKKIKVVEVANRKEIFYDAQYDLILQKQLKNTTETKSKLDIISNEENELKKLL